MSAKLQSIAMCYSWKSIGDYIISQKFAFLSYNYLAYVRQVDQVPLENKNQEHITSCDIQEDIIFDQNLYLNDGDYIFSTRGNIIFREGVKIFKKGVGNLYLKSGLNNTQGKVIFEGDKDAHVIVEGDSKVFIYYHPEVGSLSHKYMNPIKYSHYIQPPTASTSYMLVDSLKDLNDIRIFLSGNYALSSDIDGRGTSFNTIKNHRGSQPSPFVGNFDGNGFTIKNLFIETSDSEFVGIFGVLAGTENKHNVFSNVKFDNINVNAKNYVGVVSGMSEYCDIFNVTISNSSVNGYDVLGTLVGTMRGANVKGIDIVNSNVSGHEATGGLVGAMSESSIYDISMQDVEAEGMNSGTIAAVFSNSSHNIADCQQEHHQCFYYEGE